MKALMAYGHQTLLAPNHLALHPFQPGDGVYLKTWKTGSPWTGLHSNGRGPL